MCAVIAPLPAGRLVPPHGGFPRRAYEGNSNPTGVREGIGRTDRHMCRATEMDVTMVGLHNAGKTSLLRVLSVCVAPVPPLAPEKPRFPKCTGPRGAHGLQAPTHFAFSAFPPWVPRCCQMANPFVDSRVESSRSSKPTFVSPTTPMSNLCRAHSVDTFPFPGPTDSFSLLVRSAAGTLG